ncbi:hypothetical protein BBB57_03760 [Kosakonia sacchari]|nr:hypothetical protein BBB57_03760 [Kosakonia sacchari]
MKSGFREKFCGRLQESLLSVTGFAPLNVSVQTGKGDFLRIAAVAADVQPGVKRGGGGRWLKG